MRNATRAVAAVVNQMPFRCQHPACFTGSHAKLPTHVCAVALSHADNKSGTFFSLMVPQANRQLSHQPCRCCFEDAPVAVIALPARVLLCDKHPRDKCKSDPQFKALKSGAHSPLFAGRLLKLHPLLQLSSQCVRHSVAISRWVGNELAYDSTLQKSKCGEADLLILSTA